MTSMSSHLQGIMKNPVSDAERTRRRVARLETRQGKDADIADARGIVEMDPNGLQYSNEAYTFEAPNPIYIKPLFADYILGSTAEGFPFEVIGAGAFSRQADDSAGHHGIFKVTQSGANTGALARPNTNALTNPLIWNGFIFETVFFCPNISATNFIQAGFLDSLNTATPTDGIYLNYSNGSFTFSVYAGGVNTDGDFVAEVWTHDWTKIHIEVQPGGETVCSVSTRAGDGGSITLDASDAIGLDAIPMIKAYKTSAGSVDLAYFDYVACWSPFVTRW